MQYLIFGLVFGSCLFIVPLWAYRKGLKDGISITQGKPIEPIHNPVQMVIQHKEQQAVKKDEKFVSEGFANIMSYTGDEKEVVKK